MQYVAALNLDSFKCLKNTFSKIVFTTTLNDAQYESLYGEKMATSSFVVYVALNRISLLSRTGKWLGPSSLLVFVAQSRRRLTEKYQLICINEWLR